MIEHLNVAGADEVILGRPSYSDRWVQDNPYFRADHVGLHGLTVEEPMYSEDDIAYAATTVDEWFVNVVPGLVETDKARGMAEVENLARNEAVAVLAGGDVGGLEKYAVKARVFGILCRAAISAYELEAAESADREEVERNKILLSSKFDENLVRIREIRRVKMSDAFRR